MPTNFIKAIHDNKKVRVTFFSKQDNNILVRTCAPMDYGPKSNAHDKSNRFHLWDYDSDSTQHTLSLLPIQIKKIETLQEEFNPAEFVTWKTNWIIKRNWGIYS